MKKKIGIFVCCIMTITTALGAFTAYADSNATTATAESKPKKAKGKRTLAKITAVSENSITVLKAKMPEPPAKPNSDDSTTEKTKPDKPKGDTDSTERTKPDKPDSTELLSKLTFEEEMTIDISDSSIIDEDLSELKEGSLITICYDSEGNVKRLTNGNKPPHKDGESSPKGKKAEDKTDKEPEVSA